MSLLRKKESLVLCSPIPAFIPRKLAVDVLHSHGEVITLNPLVISHRPISPPPNATGDEHYSTWYEITEKISFIPGLGKHGSGTFSFNGCFYNTPTGLQTHIYAPAGVDLRVKYRIAGEPSGSRSRPSQDLGLLAAGAPSDGLWLQCDIVFECNLTLVSFVRSQLKNSIKEMVERIVRKAEILDADDLQQMIQNDYARAFESESPVQDSQPSEGYFVGQQPLIPTHSQGSHLSQSPQSLQALHSAPSLYRPYKELQRPDAPMPQYTAYKTYGQISSNPVPQPETNPYMLSSSMSQTQNSEIPSQQQHRNHVAQWSTPAVELPAQHRTSYHAYPAPLFEQPSNHPSSHLAGDQTRNGYQNVRSSLVANRASSYQEYLAAKPLPPTHGGAPPPSTWENPDSFQTFRSQT